jgi:hypothetical protein
MLKTNEGEPKSKRAALRPIWLDRNIVIVCNSAYLVLKDLLHRAQIERHFQEFEAFYQCLLAPHSQAAVLNSLGYFSFAFLNFKGVSLTT